MILYGNNGHVYGKVGTSIRFGVNNAVSYPYLTFEFSASTLMTVNRKAYTGSNKSDAGLRWFF